MSPDEHAAEALKLIQPSAFEGDNLDTFQVAMVDAARANVYTQLALLASRPVLLEEFEGKRRCHQCDFEHPESDMVLARDGRRWTCADCVGELLDEAEQKPIPAYAMLDVWMALGGDPLAFDRMWAEDRRTPADTWSQLLAVIRGHEDWSGDTNPPPGPEFEALIEQRTSTGEDQSEEEPESCESCTAPAEVTLPDGSSWCRACDDGARRLGYDDGEPVPDEGSETR